MKSGLQATIFRHDFILESKKKCYVGPDRHLTNKSYITCKLASDEKRRVLKTTLIIISSIVVFNQLCSSLCTSRSCWLLTGASPLSQAKSICYIIQYGLFFVLSPRGSAMSGIFVLDLGWGSLVTNTSCGSRGGARPPPPYF